MRGKPGKLIDLTGKRFERLTVIDRDISRNKGSSFWNCICDCGEKRSVSSQKLRSGHTKSCGCLKDEKAKIRLTVHGLTVSNKRRDELNIYCKMKKRCYDVSDPAYDRYGGRGIAVCSRWLNGERGETGFACFMADMGPRPSRSYSIDRKDNGGPYCPENCHWATAEQQARNTRTYRRVSYGGRTMGIHDACRVAGIPYANVRSRLSKGWTVERALSQPLGVRRGA